MGYGGRAAPFWQRTAIRQLLAVHVEAIWAWEGKQQFAGTGALQAQVLDVRGHQLQGQVGLTPNCNGAPQWHLVFHIAVGKPVASSVLAPQGLSVQRVACASWLLCRHWASLPSKSSMCLSCAAFRPSTHTSSCARALSTSSKGVRPRRLRTSGRVGTRCRPLASLLGRCRAEVPGQC